MNTVTDTVSVEKTNIKAIIKGACYHLFYLILGLVCAKAKLPPGIMPIGFAVCAASPVLFCVSASVGVVISSFLFQSSLYSIMTVAITFVICTVKVLTANIKFVSKSPLFCSLTAFFTMFAIRLFCFGFSLLNLVKYSFEGLVSAVFAYCFYVFFYKIDSVASVALPHSLFCTVISVGAIFTGLFSFSFSSINVGLVLSVITVLISAYVFGTNGGGIMGIALGISYLLIFPNGYSVFAVLCISGLVCGTTKSFGKAIMSLLFLSVGCIFCLIEGVTSNALVAVAEISLGSALFLLTPKKTPFVIENFISPPADTYSENGMRKALSMRLLFASNALSDLNETVEKVANGLDATTRPSFEKVILATKRDACAGCVMLSRCWEAQMGQTVDAVIELSHRNQNDTKELGQTTLDFCARCNRRQKVCETLSAYYKKYIQAIDSNAKTEGVRKIISEQFSGISRMLCDLSDEFSKNCKYDIKSAREICSAMYDIRVIPTDCSCRIDSRGKMSIEIMGNLQSGEIINRSKLLSVLKSTCNRDFCLPGVNRIGNNVLITATEKTDFEIDTASAQFCCDGNTVCGDSYETFFDGKGNMCMILSDGMGHGSRAALDSTMATGIMSRLIKAGFGYDCSLSVLNSSMMFKSTDESLATVDIATVDLYSGKAKLYKAGAAPTIIRKGPKTARAQSTSLPIGIIREIGFDTAEVTLEEGDIILMLSDGATYDGTDWICSFLLEYEGDSADEICEQIARLAKHRRSDGHSDDITVIASVIKRAS